MVLLSSASRDTSATLDLFGRGTLYRNSFDKFGTLMTSIAVSIVGVGSKKISEAMIIAGHTQIKRPTRKV